jgi:hypothetical protein
MEDDRPLSSDEMIQRAREDLKRDGVDDPDRSRYLPDIDRAQIEAAAEEELVTRFEVTAPAPAPSAPAPSRARAARPRRVRDRQLPPDPFSGGPSTRRAPGSNQAVAGAIALALVILGLAFFLAFAGTTP